jgi:hypothetical protein
MLENVDLSERYEQLIAYLSAHLPAPVEQEDQQGILVFTGGDPTEVIVRLSRSSVIVEEYFAEWATPYRLVERPRRVGIVHWRRLPESTLMSVIGQLIKGAREMRRSRFRDCRFCGTTNPPEWQHGDDVCQACAATELGAVH